MDRERLIRDARFWWPVYAAILSIIFDLIALFVGINYDSRYFLYYMLFTFLSAILLFFILFFLIKKSTYSGEIEDHTILNSEDDFLIIDRDTSIYTRTICLRANRALNHYWTYLPNNDGLIKNFSAYLNRDKNHKLEIAFQQSCGRKGLLILFKKQVKKNELINELTIEYEFVNAFESKYEGVRVTTYPSQQECIIRITIPKDIRLFDETATWLIFYGNNPEQIYSGNFKTKKMNDGSVEIVHDFSNDIKKLNLLLECAISWRWDIS